MHDVQSIVLSQNCLVGRYLFELVPAVFYYLIFDQVEALLTLTYYVFILYGVWLLRNGHDVRTIIMYIYIMGGRRRRLNCGSKLPS
mgnify:FL=1